MIKGIGSYLPVIIRYSSRAISVINNTIVKQPKEKILKILLIEYRMISKSIVIGFPIFNGR